MTGVEIEPFDVSHGAGIRDLILTIQHKEFGIPITYDDQPDLQDIEGFYRRGYGEFWVAVSNGIVVGSIALIDIGNRQAALRKMFVAKDYRGKAYGTASLLLDRLLQHSRRAGVETVFLGTTSTFLAAHRFYEKAGFQLIDDSRLPEAFPRMRVDTRFFQLDL